MHPADFYTGIVADAYTSLRSTSFDPAPYERFVRAHGEPALEIGCGDGEPVLDLCAAGLEVDGVDSSLDMVLRCRANAERRGLRPRIVHQRMEALDLGRRYSAVYLAGPTFTLLPDDRTAAAALRAIREHLTDEGAALVPLWVPDPTPAEALGVARVGRDASGAEVRYTPVSETYDVAARLRVTTSRYERVGPDGTEVADREWVVHWHGVTGFAALCAQAGLAVTSLVDDATGETAQEGSTAFTATVGRSAARGLREQDATG